MRTDILERKDEILQWIKEEKSKAFICRELKCKPETLNSYLEKMGIEYKGKQNWAKGTRSSKYKTSKEYVESSCVKSHILKAKLIRDGIKEEKCEICGLTRWMDKKIPLELHHMDGNHYNNELDNLQILCPNCHAQQNNNSGANIGYYQSVSKRSEKKNSKRKICPICKQVEINIHSSMCSECSAKSQRRAERPSREEFKYLIRTVPFTKIGEQFGVTDNAIRKWCDAYGLPRKVSEIKKYSDEEWKLI